MEAVRGLYTFIYIMVPVTILLGCCIYITGLRSIWTRRLYNVCYKTLLRINPILGIVSLVYCCKLIYLLINKSYINDFESFEGHFYYVIALVKPFILGLSLQYFAFALPAKFLGESTKIAYEWSGRLSMWGKATRAMKERWQWISIVTELITPHVVALKGERLNTISPSANSGEDEFRFTSNLANRLEIPVRMQASDFAVMKHQSSNKTANHDFVYIPGVDAKDLGQYVSDPVHLIWDMKGYLWYTSNTLFNKNKKLSHVLHMYYGLLDDGGLLVIDNGKKNVFLQLINEILIIYIPWMFYYGEGSSYSKIEKLINHDTVLKQMFSVEEVGEGKYRIAILKKKAAAQSERLVG